VGVGRRPARAILAEPALEPATSVDAVDELLDNLPSAGYFAPKVAELRGQGESIHLHCTDIEGEWMITLTPAGFAWEHAHGKGTVAVRGSAGDLVLLLYGRRRADDARLARFGDLGLLDHWLAHSAL
jgi:predicted lipid carrier protein YhbT